MTKRVAIYGRVSTEMQAEEGFSIEAQIETLKQDNIHRGYMIFDVYVDRGISGKSMDNRPDLLRMLKDAEDGLFDEVVVWKINRLGRNHFELLKIVKQLEAYGVDFRSHTEPFDTSSPTGKLMFSLIASIGEFERETIVENVKSGMKQRAKQGLFNGGRMTGYKSQKTDNDREKSILVIVPEEAELIRLIFQLFIDGHGYKYIANRLNEKGYKSIRGNLFGIHAVRDIVMNPTYAGFIRYNKRSSDKRSKTEDTEMIIKGHHEAIIDNETWDKAQAIFGSRTQGPRKVRKGVFLLTGILKCPECGSSMVAARVTSKKNGKKRMFYYYQCSKYKNYGKESCKANSIRQDYAEKYVLNKLKRFAFNKYAIDLVIENLSRRPNQKSQLHTQELLALEAKKESLSKRKERIYDLYESGDISKEAFNERMAANDKDQLEVDQHLSSTRKVVHETEYASEIPEAQIREILGNFGLILSMASRDQQKLLLNMVIDYIPTSTDRKIQKIILRFDKKTQKYLLKKDSSDDEESIIFMPFKLTL